MPHRTCTRIEARTLAEETIKSHIGYRLRLLRKRRGLTQGNLGSAVGVTFQQIQKYECGENTISAHRLWRLARAMDLQVSEFYYGLEES